MKIHLYSVFRHYQRHLVPIFQRIPSELQGVILDPRRPLIYRLPEEDVILVASAHELDGQAKQRFIYVEHGSGQNYQLPPELAYYYSGGKHPENVIGYVCPNMAVAQRWDRPSVVAGSPALDEHRWPGYIGARRKVAITFHWDAVQICPEARSARDHYIDDLPTIISWIRGAGYDPVGHAHPRDRDGEAIWRNLNIEFEPDPDVILKTCRVLIADNTSLLYEACFVGMETHVLNAPWYRRDVHHGLRFWDTIPGRMVDDAWELMSAEPSVNDQGQADHRKRVADAVYYRPPPKESAAKIAADWIVKQVT